MLAILLVFSNPNGLLSRSVTFNVVIEILVVVIES